MATHILHIPSIHCAGCISRIENRIRALAGVAAARVNLSRKELRVTAVAGLGSARIIETLAEIGFPAEEIDIAQLPATDSREAGILLKRLAVAGFGMMNVMLLSVAVWSGADAATRQLLHLVSAFVALPVLIYSAQPFFANAFSAIRAFRLNMDVPISLAILLAALASLYESLSAGDHAYFDAALALTFFLLGGRYLDFSARQKARSAAAQLARIQTPTAWQKRDGEIFEIAVSALEPGMIVVVRAGERVPADGMLRRGRADSDRSFLTGEAEPVLLVPGTEVFAGEICLNGVVEIEVGQAGHQSVLSRFIDLVEIAERGRGKYTALADRAAAVYAPLVHVLALIAFALWFWLSGDFYLAVTTAIAVLIITCPCALGLAVPAVMTAVSGQLFERGVLLKNATALERIAGIDTVVFDKTGTLTTGRFKPASLKGWTRRDLALLLELARASHHPLAKAVVDALSSRPLPQIKVDAIAEVPGSGMTGRYDGKKVKLGKPAWFAEKAGKDQDERRLGFCLEGGRTRWLDFDEVVEPGIREMLSRLDAAGIDRILLTGDNAAAAAAMAMQLGFTSCHAGMTPAGKLEFIADLKAQGASVLMVGDGLNDTGALAAADAALAPASALDAVRATADVVLLGGNIEALPFLLAMADRAKRRILQNFISAGLYNLVAVPLAFAGLVTPLLAAIAMSASSIIVVLNAVRPERPVIRARTGAAR